MTATAVMRGPARERHAEGGLIISGAPLVFLDKDDTLIRDVPYSARTEDIEWVSDAFDALSRLQEAGFRLALVTNQSGVARGDFSERQVRAYLDELSRRLSVEGVRLEGTLYCPHHPHARVERFRQDCSCRKPRPGMLRTAQARLGADLRRSWMVGDLLDDVEAGSRAGCRTVLLEAHADQVPAACGHRSPDAVADSLTAAVDHILDAAEARR